MACTNSLFPIAVAFITPLYILNITHTPCTYKSHLGLIHLHWSLYFTVIIRFIWHYLRRLCFQFVCLPLSRTVHHLLNQSSRNLMAGCSMSQEGARYIVESRGSPRLSRDSTDWLNVLYSFSLTSRHPASGLGRSPCSTSTCFLTFSRWQYSDKTQPT